MYRSTMGLKRDKLAASEEDERYLQYLKDGNDALVKCFKNIGTQSLDDEKKAKLDLELKEAEIREKQVRLEDERVRKERIMRANRILENLKSGQLALHHALVESETIHQRKYNEAVNREIAEDAKRQERLDAIQCPETLIPVSSLTEEELKAQERAKAIAVRSNFLKDIEERRQRKLVEREQEIFDGIVEREQYKCLHEEELKAAKKVVEKKQEFCRRAYRESLKEKAKIAEYENICDQIDDRVICVDVTRRRNLDKRYNTEYKAMQEKLVRDRETLAVQICRVQQETKRRDQERDDQNVDRYNVEVEIDETRRQCQIEELARQRRAYQLVEQRLVKEKEQREAEIRRFQIAGRLKSQEANKRFYISQKRRKDKATADLRDILHGQRDEFLEKRREEQMRMSACQVNPYLQEDLNFINDAARSVQKAREEGRPIYPIAKAVETYRRKNQLEVEPESHLVRRSKIRDYCWPGYHSKADLAYRQYEHRDKCRQKQEFDRHQIFANCIKITKMAAEEQPYKPCVPSCPVKCFQHRGMPPIEIVDSFDVCRDVCYEDEPPIGPCPSHMQVHKSCKNDSPNQLQQNEPNMECPNARISLSSERISDNAARDHPFIQVLSKPSVSLRPSETYRISRSDRTRTWR
ncbi:trichohyalin-like [Drosophila innubila]|uniref:trichohyalin-like n=1 Tax=Drosophila innubila TaxID=198719 RepID=UPI00148CE8A2|nr:trichohyalin-like [Drosophila innubila]